MRQRQKKVKKKIEIRQIKTFSEEFKRQKVKLLIEKKVSILELSELYSVSRTSVYRWLYKYSPHHQKGTLQVVQMESEIEKTKALQKELARLEQVVGQKQMYIDYLEQMLLIASEEFETDIKKNLNIEPYSGFIKTGRHTPTK